jgi:uncharacterized repeat protein (TIGR03803 family)
VVYELSATGHFSVLYTFTGSTDGAWPQGLALDTAGNLYGPTFYGGDVTCFPPVGCGVVYKLNIAGKTESPLHTFEFDTNGAIPNGFLTLDTKGNLYGVTVNGGDLAGCSGGGCGVVFKLDSSGNETVLYTFTGGTDGGGPNSDLVMDSKGNLYGTTYIGGDLSCSNNSTAGCGVVFEVSSTKKEKVLHTFTGSTTDGANPTLNVVRDSKGNFYSTTAYGGSANLGTIFEITATGAFKLLYSFTGSTDGSGPASGLTLDSLGNLYGNAQFGGDPSCNSPTGCGTVFKLKP